MGEGREEGWREGGEVVGVRGWVGEGGEEGRRATGRGGGLGRGR